MVTKLTNRAASVMAVLAVISLVGYPFVSVAKDDDHEDEHSQKVNICHATASEQNPWQAIQVDEDGWNGHGDHEEDYLYEGPTKQDGKPDNGGKKAEKWCTDHVPPPPPPPVPSCTLEADPAEITAGDSSTLTLHLTNATSATVDHGVGSLSDNGTAEVSPEETTTYTASIATDYDPVTCETTVTVNPVPPPAEMCTVVSDETTLADGELSVPTYVHPVWTTGLNGTGATWIWNAALADQSALPETVTFTKQFTSTAAVNGTLEIAADNGYTVLVNGVAPACDGSQANNFSAVESCAVSIAAGVNTLTFTVTNDAPANTPQNNPSGLIYRVTAEGASCSNYVPEEPPQCEPGERFAESVVDSAQGLKKNGNAVDANRSNTDEALGANDGVFFSLGFGGSITLDLGTFIENGTGDDLVVYEKTNGTYPLETAHVEVSQDNSTWYDLTEQAVNTGGGVTGIDIDETGLTWFRYVRLTDTSNPAIFPSDADGFDVDAVKAIYGVCSEPEEPPQCNPEASTTYLSSDETESVLLTDDESGPASLVAAPHANWFNALFADGLWIWKDDATSADDALNGTTETFTRTFTIVGTPEDSTLTLAIDNGVVVEVNGNEVLNDPDEHNYEAQQSVNIPAGYLLSGVNTITFTVTNLALQGGTPANNPAGLSYKLIVNNNECEEPPVDMCPNLVETTIPDGYVIDDEGMCIPDPGECGSGQRQIGDLCVAVPQCHEGEQLNEDMDACIEICSENEHRENTVCVPNETGGGGSGENEDVCANIDGVQNSVPSGYHLVNGDQCKKNSRSNGGGGGGHHSSSGGSVLGASTCGPLLSQYLNIGWDNDESEVVKLQDFLNGELGLTLPASGLFGPDTWEAVKEFQVKYGSDVLTPWVGFPGSGITGENTPTGFVYQTTRWQINNIFCPGSEAFPATLN